MRVVFLLVVVPAVQALHRYDKKIVVGFKPSTDVPQAQVPLSVALHFRQDAPVTPGEVKQRFREVYGIPTELQTLSDTAGREIAHSEETPDHLQLSIEPTEIVISMGTGKGFQLMFVDVFSSIRDVMSFSSDYLIEGNGLWYKTSIGRVLLSDLRADSTLFENKRFGTWQLAIAPTQSLNQLRAPPLNAVARQSLR